MMEGKIMSKLRSYQAITTKYFGAGNIKGSRVKATASAGSITLHWDNSLNTEQNHAKAAQALADKFGWPGRWYIGGLPNNNQDYVFVSALENDCLAFTTEHPHFHAA
jgi:hypothetical protein